MSTPPLVGIALAAYKPNIEYFRAQLQSIANQTYANWFCVIGFDSPVDEVRFETVLKPFFDDSRFQVVQNASQLGLVGNFEATGRACLSRNPKYVAYSDQDDIWYPHKIEKLVATLQTCPPMSVVHCDMQILMRQADGSFQTLPQTAWSLERRGVHHVSPVDFFIRNIAAGAGMLMHADLVRQFPSIPGEAYGQDHWYPLVASYFGVVQPFHEPLYQYRIHGDNVAGIGPYVGFFSPSRASAKLGIVRKCLLAFHSSRARLRFAVEANLPVTLIEKLVVSSRADLGLGYIVKALSVITTDKALARACVARAVGKILSIFRPGSKEFARD